MIKKYSTEYPIGNGTFTSFIYAKSYKEAKEIAKKRNLKEKITHKIKEWKEERASELFLQKKYKECAHTLCYLLYINNNNLITRKAIKDDGILHEVIHLVNDIEIYTHSSMKIIYNNIVKLEESIPGYLKKD